MLPAFVIGLREGLETVVVLGAIAVFLRVRGREDLLPRIWRVSAVAALLCLAGGLAVRFVEINLGWRQQEQLEAVVGALAVCTVTYMVVWMRRFPKDLEQDSASAASVALARDSGHALVLLAFFAVLREGFEIVVFVMATIGLSGDNSSLAGLGAVLGVVVAIAIGIGIVRGTRHLDVSRFFRVTALVLVLSAAGIAMTTVHAANAAGWVTFGQTPQFDLSWLAPPGSLLSSITTGMFGLEPYPVIIEVITWTAYFVPMMLVVLWPRRALSHAGAVRLVPTGVDGTGEAARSRRWGWIAPALVAVVIVGGVTTGLVVTSGPSRPRSTTPTNPVSPGLLYATLEGVTCPRPSYCLAVGDFLPLDKDAAVGDPDGDGQATHTLVEVSDGASWQRLVSPDAGKGGSVLNSVACPVANDCVAVGSYKRSLFGLQMTKAPPAYPLIEDFDGRAWTVATSPAISPDTTLSSVSCVSVSDCVAVGATSVGLASGNPSQTPVIEQFDGHTWSTAAIAIPAHTSAGLTSVACGGPADCVAVGEVAPANDATSTRPLIEMLEGGTWREVPLPSGSDGPGILYDVTCPSRGHCVAVGTTAALRASGAGLVLDSDGTTWSIDAGSLQVQGDATFTAISCARLGDCVVVGSSSTSLGNAPVKVAARIEGSSWQVFDTESNQGAVEGVACSSTDHCVGVGTRPVNDFGNTTVFVAGLDASGWQALSVPAP